MTFFQRWTLGSSNNSSGSHRSTSSSTSSPSRKTVSFHDFDTIYPVDKHPNSEEIWYSQYDELEFHERDYELSRLLKSLDPHMVDFLIDGEDSTRGLEYAIPDDTKRKSTRVERAVIAVLSMQYLFQEKECRHNTDNKSSPSSSTTEEESIARAYASCCEISKLEAHALAKDDAQYVADHIRITKPTIFLRGLKHQMQKQRSVLPSSPSWFNREAARRPLE